MAGEVEPTRSAVRTAIGAVVDPAGNEDAAASAAAGRTHSVVEDSSGAVVAAVASDWVADATATKNSAWEWAQDGALAAAEVVPVVAGDQLLDFHSVALVATEAAPVVLQPCCTAAAAVGSEVVVPVPTYGRQQPVSRPYSAGLDSVRMGRGGPSSYWDRGSHGTGAALDVRDTHSDRPWAASPRPAGPCAAAVVRRASPAAAAAGDAGAFRSHCGPASSRDVDEIQAGH